MMSSLPSLPIKLLPQSVDSVRFRGVAERVVSTCAGDRGSLVFTGGAHNLVIASYGQDCGSRRTQSRSARRIEEGHV